MRKIIENPYVQAIWAGTGAAFIGVGIHIMLGSTWLSWVIGSIFALAVYIMTLRWVTNQLGK